MDLARTCPTHGRTTWQKSANRSTFLGVNYYTRNTLPPTPMPLAASQNLSQARSEKTQMGWEIYPDGLHHFLTRAGP